MSFIWPSVLLSVLAVPAFLLLYLRMQRRRRQLVANYGGLGFKRERPSARHYVPTAFLMVGLTLLLVAMARPQAIVHLPRIEGTVILAFDVSGSMAAVDLEAAGANPAQSTRLEAAKAAAVEFLDHQPEGVLVGVVAFSDNGFTVQVPTDDKDAVLTTLHRLAPQSGTSLANGIFASLNLIATRNGEPPPGRYIEATPSPSAAAPPGAALSGPATPAAIVLLSDGENNEDPDPLEAAQAAADQGVRIYTVGIGTLAGTTLEVNGFVVHTQLQEATLEQIAEDTGGQYYSAGNPDDLRSIFENIDLKLASKPEEMEVTSLFAGASILALLAGAGLSLLWFGRVP